MLRTCKCTKYPVDATRAEAELIRRRVLESTVQTAQVHDCTAREARSRRTGPEAMNSVVEAALPLSSAPTTSTMDHPTISELACLLDDYLSDEYDRAALAQGLDVGSDDSESGQSAQLGTPPLLRSHLTSITVVEHRNELSWPEVKAR